MRKSIVSFMKSGEEVLYNKIPYINPCYALYFIFQLVTFFIFSRLAITYNLHWWTPQLWIDISLPLVMPMVVPYVLYAPFMIMPIFLSMKKTQERFLVLNLSIASVCNYILAFTISSHVHSRVPLFDQEEGILLYILSWIYKNDPNSLYFPSLHVVHSFLIGFHLWESNSYRRIFLFIAIFIAVSTVFVKQHFLLDSLVGVIFAVTVFYLTPYVIRRLFVLKSKYKKKKLEDL